MRTLFRNLTLIIALFFFFKGSYAQSSTIDSLSALIPVSKGNSLAEVYLNLGKEYLYSSPAKVIEYAQLALPIILENKNEKQESYVNLLLGSGYLFSGDFENGKKYTELGLALAKKLNDTDYTCSGLNSLASYYMNTGDYSQALLLYQEALELAQNNNLEERVATIQVNIGAILTNTGDRINGLKYLLQSLKYFENKGNDQLITRIYNNVAVNYHAWKEYDKALSYYQKALENYMATRNYPGQAITYNNIGEVYKDKKEFNSAIDYYEKTLTIADKTEAAALYKAYGWVGLAEAYFYTKDITRCRQNAILALESFESLNMREGISNAKLILACVNFDDGNPTEALVLINQSLEIIDEMGLIDLKQRAYDLKARIFSKQMRYQDANEMLTQYILVTDILNAQHQLEESTRIRSEFELSEKETEIELLQKNNEIKDLQLKRKTSLSHFFILTIILLFLVFAIMSHYVWSRKKSNDILAEKNKKIQQQHEELINEIETKNKFLSIIGHDLRNPIGAFKDVVSQLADFPEMFSDELREQIINELRDEAESTYFLLDNLLVWANSQRNNIKYKLEKLDLHMLVNNNILLHSRLSENKKISITSDFREQTFAYADHNMVNLILRNLISNAIKFTEMNGKINISTKESGDFLEVSVTDTGIGIPAEILPHIFNKTNHISTYGTNHEKGSGLGLLLCKEFVEINGGSISVSSVPKQGSTFTFTLKKYSEVT